MAITNAQQYQQLVNKRADGKRPGYRGEGGYQGGATNQGGAGNPGGDGPQRDTGLERQRQRNIRAVEREQRIKDVEDLIDRPTFGFTDAARINLFNYSPTSLAVKGIKNLGTAIANSRIAEFMNAKQREAYLDSLTTDEQVAALEALGKIGIGTTNPMGIDRNITRGTEKGILGTNIGGGQFITDPNLGSVEAKTALGQGYQDYLDDITSRFDDTGDRGGDTYIPPIIPQVASTVDQEPELSELEKLLANRMAYRFMADGGRAGFQQGSPAPIAPKVDPRMAKSLQENIAANEAQRTSNIARKEAQRKAIEDIRNAISSGGKEGLGSFLKQQFGVANPSQVPGYSSYSSPLTGISSFAKDRMTNALIQNYLNPSAQGSSTYGSGNAINPYASMFVQTPGGMFGNPNPYDVSSAVQSGYGVMLDGNLYKSEQDAIDALGIERYNQLMADGGRAGFMNGGMSDDDLIGGLADGSMDEMGRQMYGLGKLVKKATGAIKKIVKSPVGKAALAFGMYKFGAPLFKSEGFKNFFLKDASKKFALSNLSNKGILAGIGGISALSGLMSQPEEDEEEQYYRGEGLDIAKIRANPYDYMGPAYRFRAAEGGNAEPVAKDTMPLLDMNGMEKDYRADGGFVPIGRMERADDVPARLSKNEFVFTADAVRNAGDGDVDKGAEVMYNMMKNLESGGKVSEESQGLDGARNMFQTSKRLEEVL